MNKSPERLTDISGEQWLFETFSAADSSYSAIQETVNARRGSESGNNQFNSFLQGGVEDGTGSVDTAAEETDLHVLEAFKKICCISVPPDNDPYTLKRFILCILIIFMSTFLIRLVFYELL